MRLTLPLPPSVNGAFRNTGAKERYAALRQGRKPRPRVKSKAYKSWLAVADMWLLTQKRGLTPVLGGPLVLEIRVPAAMRGDVSNRIKVAEDYLVSRQLTPDDKHNWSVTVTRDPDVERGMCVIEVKGREVA